MEFILYLNLEIGLKADEFTWQATIIFNSKKYEDAPMRGRTSFDPIEKMGLAALSENKICITDMGGKFLSGEIEIGDVMLAFLLKFQYPNPLMDGFTEYNTRPFVNTLRIIKKVNELCVAKNVKAKGISKTDTINTFWVSVKYEYEGRRQKIIPITISQLIKLLESEKRNKIAHTEIQSLFEKCADTGSLKDSSEWKNVIDTEILNYCARCKNSNELFIRDFWA